MLEIIGFITVCYLIYHWLAVTVPKQTMNTIYNDMITRNPDAIKNMAKFIKEHSCPTNPSNNSADNSNKTASNKQSTTN